MSCHGFISFFKKLLHWPTFSFLIFCCKLSLVTVQHRVYLSEIYIHYFQLFCLSWSSVSQCVNEKYTWVCITWKPKIPIECFFQTNKFFYSRSFSFSTIIGKRWMICIIWTKKKPIMYVENDLLYLKHLKFYLVVGSILDNISHLF